MNKNERITRQFAKAINEVSRENESNTPDFLLAEFLTTCLCAFENAVTDRAKYKNPPADECREETREELMESRDEWRRQAYEQQKETARWKHGHAEYKKALAKCSGDLLECIKAKDNQTRKLKETLNELTDLKMAMLNEDDIKPMEPEELAKQPKNFINVLADTFGKIADIIGAQKRREADAAILKWRIEWVTNNIKGTRKNVFTGHDMQMANVYSVTGPDNHVYSFRIFDKAEKRVELFEEGVRYIAERLNIFPTADGTTAPGYGPNGFEWKPEPGKDDNAAPEYYGKPRPN